MCGEKIAGLLKIISEKESHKAFKELYMISYDRLFRTAYFYLGNDDDARDITMSAFGKLWDNRSKLCEIKDFNGYSFIMIKNLSLAMINNRSGISDNADLTDQEPAGSDPETDYVADELFKLYNDCVDDMPEKMKEAYIKIKEDKMAYADAAKEMKISEKTVDAHIQKAMGKLRKKLSEYL